MKRGAEATVKMEENSVIKERRSKEYRHPDLDRKIREERTEREKKIMKEARSAGVNVPRVDKQDVSTLEIEKVEGQSLKHALDETTDPMEELGRNVALLHGNDIIHGDLTTSNVIIQEDGAVVIDFGLSKRSQRVEDRAVDLHLLKQVLESSHPEVAEEAWENFVGGYRSYEESEKVLERLEEVEERGRYK